MSTVMGLEKLEVVGWLSGVLVLYVLLFFTLGMLGRSSGATETPWMMLGCWRWLDVLNCVAPSCPRTLPGCCELK